MNRRKFFKRLLVGATAIVVVPKVIAEVTKPDPYKNLYYPSMQDITYEQFLRYCNVKLPSGQMIVYGTVEHIDSQISFEGLWK